MALPDIYTYTILLFVSPRRKVHRRQRAPHRKCLEESCLSIPKTPVCKPLVREYTRSP